MDKLTLFCQGKQNTFSSISLADFESNYNKNK